MPNDAEPSPVNAGRPPDRTRGAVSAGGTSGGIYGLAFLGALVYYLQHATGWLSGLLGIAKAIFWPAVLMHKVLELLKM